MHPHVYWYLANKAVDAEKYLSGELGQLRADPPGAMRDEIALALHPYVLLKFLPFSETGEKPVPLAVVFHRDSAPLIVIRHDWQVGLDTEDCECLIELMDNCTNTAPEGEVALFQQLECLSTGRLRATGSGIATAESLVNLMHEVLGRAGFPGRWMT